MAVANAGVRVPLLNVSLDNKVAVAGGGKIVVNNPRPCVAAAKVRSDARNFNISTLTFAKPEFEGVQVVAAPLRASVVQTPNSVAINALVASPGKNIAHLTGISGKLPCTDVQTGVADVAFFVSKSFTTP